MPENIFESPSAAGKKPHPENVNPEGSYYTPEELEQWLAGTMFGRAKGALLSRGAPTELIQELAITFGERMIANKEFGPAFRLLRGEGITDSERLREIAQSAFDNLMAGQEYQAAATFASQVASEFFGPDSPQHQEALAALQAEALAQPEGEAETEIILSPQATFADLFALFERDPTAEDNFVAELHDHFDQTVIDRFEAFKEDMASAQATKLTDLFSEDELSADLGVTLRA